MQINIPEDATEPQLVLIFNVRPVAALVDFHAERVFFSKLYKTGDVKLAWIARPLRVANVLAIDPDRKRRVYPFESQPLLVIGQFFRHGKRGPVPATFIIVERNMWRVYW